MIEIIVECKVKEKGRGEFFFGAKFGYDLL